MTTKLYIARETTCPNCKGERVVQPKLWADYWAWVRAFRQVHGRMPTTDEEPGWAADLPASEEVQCPDCHGSGTIAEKREISATLDALRELASQLAEFAHAYQDDKLSDYAEGIGGASERLVRALRELEI